MFLAASVLMAAAAGPQTTSVEITVRPASPAPLGASSPCVIRATPLGGRGTEPGAAIEVRSPVPGSVSLTVARDLVWRFEAVSDAWWSAPVISYLAAAGEAVNITAWPSAALVGRLKQLGREPAPDTVRVRFQAAARAERRRPPGLGEENRGAPYGEAECRVTNGAFRCRLPAAPLDLRLRCQGYVSFYRWAQDLPRGGQLDLGQLTLIPGASVVGQVATTGGPPDPNACRVKLTALTSAVPGSPQEAGRWASKTFESTVDRNGFFTFEGLGPGIYVAEASQPGFVPASTGRFTVYERAESELRQAMVLERPISVRVAVTPARPQPGARWGLALYSVGLVPTHLETVFEGPVGEDGTLVINALAPGRVKVALYESPGVRTLFEERELSPTTTDLVIKVAWVEVAGRVFLGKQPLAADIWFGRRTGSVKGRMESNDDGEFVGSLPRGGRWAVQVTSETPHVDRVLESVEVRPDPDTERAEVELRLPDTLLSGTVVDEEGDGVAAARIDLEDVSRGVLGGARSAEGGNFEFAGLASGPYVLSAADGDAQGPRESARLRVVVPETGSPAAVRLVLLRKREVRGIVWGDGQPVPGARVALYGDWRSPAPAWSETAMTDSSGRFRLLVSRSCREFLIYVMAPGFSLRAFDAVEGERSSLDLNVTSLGGNLSVTLPSSVGGRGSNGANWLLWQDGLPLFPSELQQWSQASGGPQAGASGGAVYSRLALGNYSACVFKNPSDLMTACATGQFGAGHCASGFLPPGGDLSLDLRDGKRP